MTDMTNTPSTTTPDPIQQITGNITDELTEAGYRIAADQLVDLVTQRILASKSAQDLGDTARVSNFLTSEPGEAIVSFALAVILELPWPGDVASDFRRTMASQLRIQAYQELGETLLGAVGLLLNDVQTVKSGMLMNGGRKKPLEAKREVEAKKEEKAGAAAADDAVAG
jgi:hypothetical protein